MHLTPATFLPYMTAPGLSPSSLAVLDIIVTEGSMTHKDIVKKSSYSPRTIRNALKKLREKKLLVAKVNIHDMRQIIYENRTPLKSMKENGDLLWVNASGN